MALIKNLMKIIVILMITVVTSTMNPEGFLKNVEASHVQTQNTSKIPLSSLKKENPNRLDINWDVQLTFQDPSILNDYVVFGEAMNASDGPPADEYDSPKPPPPMRPYLRAFLDDNQEVPYNKLMQDYRRYPDTRKIWNISVIWMPVGDPASTLITISWEPGAVNESEYTKVILCSDTGIPLQDMRLYKNYTFDCLPYVLYNFNIICSINHLPNSPSSPHPLNQSTGVSTNLNVSWFGDDPDNDTVSYDVYFGALTPPPKVIGNQSMTMYDPETMSAGTTYYWQIVAYDTNGGYTIGPLWVFTTNYTPFQSDSFPLNGSFGVERPPIMLQVTLTDVENSSMNASTRWKNHSGQWMSLQNLTEVGNGTYAFIPAGNDWIWGNTTYTWSVNVTDGMSWANQTYVFTTGGSRYDVNNNDKVNFQDAGLVWVHRTSVVPYDGLYDVNGNEQVNFQDAGLTWTHRD